VSVRSGQQEPSVAQVGQQLGPLPRRPDALAGRRQDVGAALSRRPKPKSLCEARQSLGVERSESGSAADGHAGAALIGGQTVYKNILVATDGTRLSGKAVAHAIALAKALGGAHIESEQAAAALHSRAARHVHQLVDAQITFA